MLTYQTPVRLLPEPPFWLGPNDIDNEARPTEKRRSPDVEQAGEDMDGFEVMLPDDGRLGLTNYGDVPADDWAADSGETKTPDSE